MRSNRTTERTETVEDLNAEGVQTETQEKASEGTAEKSRAPRPQIDTSGVTVGEPVTDPTLGRRASKLDTDPVSMAVQSAEKSTDAKSPKWYPLVLNGKDAKGVQSIATRAAARVEGLGIRFDKSRVASHDTLYFYTTDKRKTTRKTKDAAAPVEGAASE